jgi:hypothetical protein
MKIFMLLLAFTIVNPDGEEMDENVHVLSRHFDTGEECRSFVNRWADVIRKRGPEKVQEMLDDEYTIKLNYIGCVEKPNRNALEVRILPKEEYNNDDH